MFQSSSIYPSETSATETPVANPTSTEPPVESNDQDPTTSQETGLRKKFPCIHCTGNGYSTQRGLSQHMLKKHPQQWNDTKKQRLEDDGPKQHHWVDGDFEMLCIGEDEHRSTKPGLAINKYIQAKYFPTVTSEGVKYQRGTAAFKRYRVARQAKLEKEGRERDQQALSPGEAPTEQHQQTAPQAPLEIHDLTPDEVDELMLKPHGETMREIHQLLHDRAYQLATGKAIEVFESMATEYTRLDKSKAPQPKKEREACEKVGRQRHKKAPKLSPSKELRRQLFHQVQRTWKKKRKSVVDQILAGKLGTEQR